MAKRAFPPPSPLTKRYLRTHLKIFPVLCWPQKDSCWIFERATFKLCRNLRVQRFYIKLLNDDIFLLKDDNSSKWWDFTSQRRCLTSKCRYCIKCVTVLCPLTWEPFHNLFSVYRYYKLSRGKGKKWLTIVNYGGRVSHFYINGVSSTMELFRSSSLTNSDFRCFFHSSLIVLFFLSNLMIARSNKNALTLRCLLDSSPRLVNQCILMLGKWREDKLSSLLIYPLKLFSLEIGWVLFSALSGPRERFN